MRVMLWEVKVSKLCNLRCSYCYEYPELGNTRRISLDNWRTLLENIRWYQERLEKRGEPVITRIVWHGGEPLLLPLAYYREVLALERDILGDGLNTTYTNHVPTNLYSVPPDTLAFLREEHFQVAVSFDAISGVRLNVAGQPTEDRVEANLRRLLDDGWTVGCNVVLARHTAGSLTTIYDRLRDITLSSSGGLYVTLIPLHGTATGDAGDGHTALGLSSHEIVDALFDLFVHWTHDRRPISHTPVEIYYLDVVRKLAGLPRAYFDRRSYGESALVVNTDGSVYEIGDIYDPSRSLGCIFTQSLADILESPAYAASLDRDDVRARRYCGTCPYDGYCNHEPILKSYRDDPDEHCAVGFPLHQKIERWLVQRQGEGSVGDIELPHPECLLEAVSA